ncbi:Gfo/Idh/MocA family protein [Maritalea porphyrae]|uniref:Gfo/Idh/MocA family protein n=1 Tax=Maritalea porphyrae TaxID=880732 RepID=UPI0022B04935|nr:Gfo/Idh/MocA family oxidoreductase [Maritalea porphyrae]MCZ4272164.1 Gfo/Idh/MocA family oxidoreductase [Maritalea porphyrae]
MDEKTSVGVIGLGIMGRRMLEALSSHDKFYASHIWDPSAVSVAKATPLAPEARVCDSPEAVIEGAKAIYLACPPDPRRLYAMIAADCGKPLFLEKPLGINMAASRSMVHHLEKTRVPAAVNFVQATGEPLAAIKTALQSGEMGDLVGIDIEVSYAQWPRLWQKDAAWLKLRSEGGMTREVISHFMFFAERLLGTTHLNWTSPIFPDETLCETNLSARLFNPDGLPLNVFANVGGAQPDKQRVFVKGTKKSFKVEQFSELWVSEGDRFSQVVFPSDNARIDGLHVQLDHFDKCIRGEPHLLATIQEALSVQEKIEGMLAG